MAKPVRASVRLWQTELFVIVIVVAILILSASLTQGLVRTLTDLGKNAALNNASALASSIGPRFPLTPQSLTEMKREVTRHRFIYGDDVWVYDLDGKLLIAAAGGAAPPPDLEKARAAGLADTPPYASMTLKSGGYAVAGKAIYDVNGNIAGSLVLADPVTTSLAVLSAVRNRLWITFWVALVVAGLLGFVFSEFIARRVRRMTLAASAIAAGDFEQRLPTGLVPDEIHELAESYNQMAVTLGEAFSALSEREQEITAVVESMAEGVVAFDAGGLVRVINPEARRLLDDPVAELVGMPATAVTDDPNVLDILTVGLAGAGASATARLGERTVLLHCTPLLDEDGTVQGAVLLMGDVTEQKRTEDAQRRFVANASHEMRTPITAIKGMLELLEGGAKDDPEVRDDFVHTMQLEVDRLGRLVADLLTLAQIDAGGIELKREPESVRAIFEDVRSVMNPLAARADVALAIDLPEGELEVLCDRDRIAQVLLGFVDNALKHSAAGQEIVLRARRSGDLVTLLVADEGSGIPPEAMGRLFDRFYRADESRAMPRGSGLGLSIAKEIVESHGSDIRVESAPGAGATFAFDLPLAP